MQEKYFGTSYPVNVFFFFFLNCASLGSSGLQLQCGVQAHWSTFHMGHDLPIRGKAHPR